MMVTVVSALAPATIPSGSAPKESFTDSSSSIKSSGAVNLNVFWVSPDTNTTLDGTPE